ncbi:MAG: hypothetical protein K8R53_12240 [Bacteroidales bacterium]|nr:hypothetical protein [Bacteroidales bacterium]
MLTTWEIRAAKIFTYIFHPLLIPLFMLIWVLATQRYFSLMLSKDIRPMLIGMTAIITFFLPSIFILILYRRKIISSMEAERREDRFFPYVIVSIFFYLAFHLYRQLQILHIFQIFMLGATSLVIICLFINFFWKISIHMTGIGGVFGAFVGIASQLNESFLISIALIIMISGLIGFARLALKAHTHSQIYTGFLTGSTVMFLIYLIAS